MESSGAGSTGTLPNLLTNGDNMITREKLENHVSHLEEKMKVLKREVEDAYHNGSDLHWEELKKKKLKLKDEIESCQRQITELSQK